jgi:hypothetical protein
MSVSRRELLGYRLHQGVDERLPQSAQSDAVLILLTGMELGLHYFPSDPILASPLTSQEDIG